MRLCTYEGTYVHILITWELATLFFPSNFLRLTRRSSQEPYIKYWSHFDCRVIMILFSTSVHHYRHDHVSQIKIFSITDHQYGIQILVIMYPIFDYFVLLVLFHQEFEEHHTWWIMIILVDMILQGSHVIFFFLLLSMNSWYRYKATFILCMTWIDGLDIGKCMSLYDEQ